MLREMVGFTAQRLMELDSTTQTARHATCLATYAA